MFNDTDELIECGEVAIVHAETTGELPDALDRIQFRAVRGKKVEGEVRVAPGPPGLMEARVVVPDVVCDEDDSAPGARAAVVQAAEKIEEGLGIEAVRFAPMKELPVAQTHCTKIADALARRVMQHDRIGLFGRNPHATPRAVLLEVHLVQRPEVDRGIAAQAEEFFL